MPTDQSLRATGDRIDQLLDELHTAADPRLRNKVDETLRLITDLYGAGLARVLEVVAATSPAAMTLLVEDDLVSSLLLVHGLHPEDMRSRIERALQSVRPFLARHDGDVELVELDPDAGAVLLRLLGSCDGCPSSSITLERAVRQAIVDAAPEVITIDVGTHVPATAVALGSKPVRPYADAECPVPALDGAHT